MTTDPNSHPTPRHGFPWVTAILFLFVGVGLSAILVGAFHMAPLFLKSHTEFRSQPSIVEKIQQLQRLETVVYTIDKIVEGDRQSLILPDFLGGDKILLVAHGEVVAGVDLGGLQSSDVVISGRKIHVHLPPAQIFTIRLDSAQTRVYSRITGLLVSADQNLESEVRQKAEQQIREGALADGILNKATLNARTTLRSLLLSLGFETVEIV